MAKTFQVAKTLCSLSDWKMTNLSLQKLLYLAHMYYLGTYQQPLIDGHFEAWNFGPVEPELYHKVKAYGNGPIVDVFPCPSLDSTSDEYKAVVAVYNQLKDIPSAMLVSITHQECGAWAQCYRPNVRGIVIQNEEIRNEYIRRTQGTTSASV